MIHLGIQSFFLLMLSWLSPDKAIAPPEPITLEQLQTRTIKPANDTLYIVNFWATWCAPCVKELPYFAQSELTFNTKKVKTLLVSLDFVKDLERVRKFAESKRIVQDIYILNAGNPNIWIDKIDPAWSGAIPATALYRNGKKVLFHEGELNQSALDSIIQLNLK